LALIIAIISAETTRTYLYGILVRSSAYFGNGIPQPMLRMSHDVSASYHNDIKSIHYRSFLEDKGEGHWYASVLNNDAVQDFLDMALTEPGEHEVDEFTLTVAVPSQSRSHHGIKIISLITSGRCVIASTLRRWKLICLSSDLLAYTFNE
jgi:hypothetical protein